MTHPANLREHAPSHPGFDAPDCYLRYTVVAAAYGTSHDGYGCRYTGGHCLPGENCARLGKLFAEEQD